MDNHVHMHIKTGDVPLKMGLEEITRKSKKIEFVDAHKAIVVLCSKYPDITNNQLGRIL